MTNPTPHGQVPEALRLAHIFDNPLPPEWPDMVAAAAELRRQHARIAELESELEAVGAGGVQAYVCGHRPPCSECATYAAPQAAVAAGWMPIETAPKDGRAILVSEGRFCYCVEWNEELDWWAVDDNKLGPFRLRGSAPTHWMPLPAPPTEGESNG